MGFISELGEKVGLDKIPGYKLISGIGEGLIDGALLMTPGVGWAILGAKAGVHAWAKGLSREMGKHGITINCLSPGRIHSEQIDQRLHPTAESQAEFARNIPLGYFGDPADLAYLAVCLCSPRARYITGERIAVDGGLHRAI